MQSLGNLYQSGDWKGEKHVPVIHAPEVVKKGDLIELKVSIGDEIPHPNNLEHHILWIKVYFLAEGAKFPVEVGTCNFTAHGEGGVFTEPSFEAKFKAEKSGTIYASSYCNIHGLWENNTELKIED